MTKLPLHTPDLTNKNYTALTSLFPNAVTETVDENGKVIRSIDADVLAQEINTHVVSGKEERYQFTWPDKKKTVLLANAPINATLRPSREESVNFDNTENLYIEGDNLDVLKLLRETYLNRIKMIYIDPPYNTGNDFIYEDNFAENSDEFLDRDYQYDDEGNRMVRNLDSNGRFHTDWLNMMYPRLRIARDLLTDDGVIFISIDDNEVENLKKICNEIFGESSFVTNLHVQMSTVQGMKVKAAKDGNIVKNGEHILVYSKNGNKTIGIKPMLDPAKYDNHYNKFLIKSSENVFLEKNLTDVINENAQIISELKLLDLMPRNSTSISQSKLQEYYMYSPTFRLFIKENAANIVRVHDAFIPDNVEKMVVDKIYYYCFEKRSYFLCKDSNGNVTQRISLAEKLATADDFYKTFGPTTIRGDWWEGFYLDMGNVNKEGDVSFDNGKKPIRLLKQLIGFVVDKSDIILDFFSGSATTAHAVMQLNAEDKVKRRFIMVQLDEDLDKSLKNATGETKKSLQQSINFLDKLNKPHFLTEIGKERIRRAGKKIVNESPLDRTELDIGFRVLKLDSGNMKDVYYTPQDTVSETGALDIDLDGFVDNIKADRTPEDLLFQVMLDLGILLSSKIEKFEIEGKTVFSVADNYLLACFDRVTDEIVTEIAKNKPYYAVFRDSSFYNDATLVNFEQIFKTYSPTTIRKIL